MGELYTGRPVFPGESEIDQLYIIQKCLGALTPEQSELFLSNPTFTGLKFPDMANPLTLGKKYFKKIPSGALALMGVRIYNYLVNVFLPPASLYNYLAR